VNFINNLNNIDFNKIIFYLTSSEIQETLFPVKVVFSAIFVILMGIIVFIMSRTNYLKWLFVQDLTQFITMRPFGAKRITGQWNKVLGRLEAGAEAEYKLAVIEADDLMDASLKKMGYDGQTLEEKLGKLTSVTLPNIQQLLEVHRLRNNIVHDPDYRLTLEEAKKAMDVYNKAFQDLQILEK